MSAFDSQHLSRRHLLGAGAALAATAALGACGDDDDDDASPAAGTTNAPAGSPASAAKIPGEFVVANEAEPDDLLPYFGGFSQALVMRMVYETLFEVRMSAGSGGAAEIKHVPALAERWEQLNPTTFRFFLRQGVTFHDGEAWNAAAAKASFDVMADPELAKQLKKSPFLPRGVKSVAIVDPMTVEVTTPAPVNLFELGIWIRLGFSAISPKALRDRGLAAMLESPAGTGPFRFKSWTRGQDLKLERFEPHWQKPGTNLKALRFVTRKEASVRALTVRTGETHFAFNIGAEQASTLKKSVVAGGFQSSSLRLNNAIAPTNDVRVRRALNLAVDREAIAKSIFKGTATPIGFFAFQPVKVDPFPYRPEEARKLLDEAGVRGQTLELVYGEGRIPEEDQLAELYRALFEQAGLKIKLTKLEPRQYNELGGKPFQEQPPLYMETTSSGNYGEIAGGLNDKYGCKGTGTFCKPEFDAEFAKLAALAGDERTRLLQSVAERLQRDETPRLWTVGVRQVHGIAENVKADLPLNAYVQLTDLSFA